MNTAHASTSVLELFPVRDTLDAATIAPQKATEPIGRRKRPLSAVDIAEQAFFLGLLLGFIALVYGFASVVHI